MNLKPEALDLSTPEAKKIVENSMLLQSTFFTQDTVSSASKKRKWDDLTYSTLATGVGTVEGNSLIEETSNVKTAADNIISYKNNVSQCSGNSEFVKKLKTLGRKEINVLRIQIAMISDNDGDSFYFRPIHVAIAQENLKLVRKLCALMLKAAIPLDLTNHLRQTPLHLAVMLGNTDMISLLLKYGASIYLKDRNGNSVVHLAVKTNVEKDVLELILGYSNNNSLLNFLDHEGYSALHYAVLKSNATAVRCLRNADAWMDIIDGKSGRSPLIHAILEQNSEMVSLLLECGASAETIDYSGRTAFELALQLSNKQIIKLLEKFIFCDTSSIEGGISQENSNSKNGSVFNTGNKRTRNERIPNSMRTRSNKMKTDIFDAM